MERLIKTASQPQAKCEMMEVHLANSGCASKRDSAPNEQPSLLAAIADERKFSTLNERLREKERFSQFRIWVLKASAFRKSPRQRLHDETRGNIAGTDV